MWVTSIPAMGRAALTSTLLALTLLACGNPPVGEPPTGAIEEDDSAPAAVTRDGRGTFFLLREDAQGIHVRRANYDEIECPDGARSIECHVNVMRAPAIAADRVPETLFRGQLVLEDGATVFAASEVWSPDVLLGKVPRGTFFRVERAELLCAKAPCPSMRQAKLNSKAPAQYLQTLSIDDELGTAERREAALGEAHSTALLVVGENNPRREGLSLQVKQYYRRVDAPATADLSEP
jgi:hypothetical protein